MAWTHARMGREEPCSLVISGRCVPPPSPWALGPGSVRGCVPPPISLPLPELLRPQKSIEMGHTTPLTRGCRLFLSDQHLHTMTATLWNIPWNRIRRRRRRMAHTYVGPGRVWPWEGLALGPWVLEHDHADI